MADAAYEPRGVEEKWYKRWEEAGAFRPADGDDTFCVVIPPPNITGNLHMGHALNSTLQDICVRYQRMLGKATLWLPGTDHAGIATQNVVERRLASEGTSRHDIGREEFVRRVWAWREQYGRNIVNQLRRMGASCDWTRERFTLDEQLQRAVREHFCSLWDEGLIYRGHRIINWCIRCHTALSDSEVEHEDKSGHLWHIAYPLADGGEIIVATTRPETMLGDTAVAVSPEDERYAGVVGRTAILPLMDRPIPIIADVRIEVGFGTGALKVTPGHDPVDFEIGQRHNLPAPSVIDGTGTMTEEAGRYVGLERYECRKAVVADLEKLGLLRKTEDYAHAVGQCYRCGTVVEPLVSDQWFVNVAPQREMAIAAIREGRVRIVPGRWTGVALDWLENLRDWCISRQLWWGHRVPVWTCANGHAIAYREDPAECAECGSKTLEQDPDVLDTWFSSALWPFSTLGWPDRANPDLARFYPTSLLITGYEILAIWVCKMIMSGLKFMDDVPFHDVYIHGIVRDSQGRKMSKSLGNTIDPLELTDRFGTDALRLTLAQLTTMGGQDIFLSEERVQGARNFSNKLWNASRFVGMAVPAERHDDVRARLAAGLDLAALGRHDRWVLSRLSGVEAATTEALESYRYNDVAGGVYEFTWHEYCDWYLEMAKGRLRDEGPDATVAMAVLCHVLGRICHLLHPIMPFITEEIWEGLPHSDGMLITGRWPAEAGPTDELAEAEVGLFMAAVSAARTIRSEWSVNPGAKPAFYIQPASGEEAALLADEMDAVVRLTGAGAIHLGRSAPEGEIALSSVTAGGTTVEMVAEGAFDLSAERARLSKQLDKADADLSRSDAKLANEGFTSRAPADVVQRERDRRDELAAQSDRLRDQLRQLS